MTGSKHYYKRVPLIFVNNNTENNELTTTYRPYRNQVSVRWGHFQTHTASCDKTTLLFNDATVCCVLWRNVINRLLSGDMSSKLSFPNWNDNTPLQGFYCLSVWELQEKNICILINLYVWHTRLTWIMLPDGSMSFSLIIYPSERSSARALVYRGRSTRNEWT